MNNIGQYINEIKIAAVLISFWILIYIFFKTNLSPTKMINSLDNIIDKVVYGNMSQQEAMEELTIMRCGSDVNHIVKNDLSTYLNSFK